MENTKDKLGEKKKCFVIMPIADTEGYEIGHFKRVYEYIIKPAIIKAGFEPMRADEVNKANFIIIDILKQIISSDIAICDLSSRNPNVLYELGIRQAFNLPVCLLKDNKTTRMFDIQGFRDVEYDEKLRIDNVEKVVDQLAKNIMNTYESKGEDINSIIQLMGIKAAELENTTVISNDTNILLNAIENMGKKVSILENKIINKNVPNQLSLLSDLDESPKFNLDEDVYCKKYGFGVIVRESDNEGKITAKFENGKRYRFSKNTNILEPVI